MIDETTIHARIAVLESELAAFIAQANATAQAYQTAIGELKRLLAPPESAPTEYIGQTVGSETHDRAIT